MFAKLRVSDFIIGPVAICAGVVLACSAESSGSSPMTQGGTAGQAGTATMASAGAGASTAGTAGAGSGVGGGAGSNGGGGSPGGGMSGGGGALNGQGGAGAPSSGSGGGGAGGSAGAGGGHPRVDPRGSNYCDEQPLYLGDLRLLTNEWTDPAAETCVFLEESGEFGWKWQRGATGLPPNPTYPNYPEVEFGINPWNTKGIDESTTSLLPLQLKDFSSASMTVEVRTDVGGNNHGWNLAFELWLSDKDPTLGPANPKGEIMVFLSNAPDYYPQEPETAQTLNDGIHTYKLYVSSDNWGSWGYYRQYRLDTHDGNFSGKLDIGAFLKHYREQEKWNGELWVTRFELGNEVYQNSGGTTTFKSLSFEVNGQTRTAETVP